MKIVTDLKEGEAVKFDDSFLINLSSGTYEIDGSELSVHYGGRQIMVNSMDVIYHITKSNPVHIGFSKDGKPFGDFEEWKRLATLNRDYVENGYPSLDEEFRLRSELKKYNDATKVMSTPETVKTRIEIPIVGEYINTGSEFIVAALYVGNVSFNGRGAFKVRASAIAKDEIAVLKVNYPKLDNSTHSNVRYLKYGGSFVFHGSDEADYAYVKGENVEWLVNTLDEAKAKEKSVRDLIRSRVLLLAEPISIDQLPAVTLDNLFNKVNNALTQVRSLQPMKSSQSERTHAINYLREASEEILKVIKTNESTVSS